MQALLNHWQFAGAILGFWITFAFAVPLAWPLIVRLPIGRNLNRSWTAWMVLMLCWMTMVPIASLVVVLVVTSLLGRVSSPSWVEFIFVSAGPFLGACVLGGYTWAHYHYSPPNYFWRSRSDRLKLAAGLAVVPSIAVFFILLQLYSMFPFPSILSRLPAPGGSNNEVWVFEINSFEEGRLELYAVPKDGGKQRLNRLIYPDGNAAYYYRKRWTKDGEIFVCWERAGGDEYNPKIHYPQLVLAYNFTTQENHQLNDADLAKLVAAHGGWDNESQGDQENFRPNATIPWYWQLPSGGLF